MQTAPLECRLPVEIWPSHQIDVATFFVTNDSLDLFYFMSNFTHALLV
jgi:hypothetical protein